MRRRKFTTLVCVAAVAWPLTVRAQTLKVPTIGILLTGNPDPEIFLKGFRDALRDVGYTDGQNIRLEVRSAEGKSILLPQKAAELVGLKVDVIVAALTPAIQAAKQATPDIPIVMAPAGEPVGTGLVASLARPGGNVTGVSAATAELAGKSLELIREALPSARRVAVLANEADPLAKPFLEQIAQGRARLGSRSIQKWCGRRRRSPQYSTRSAVRRPKPSSFKEVCNKKNFSISRSSIDCRPSQVTGKWRTREG